ncbi:class I SAM-dependent methyltransferase [Rhodoferax sp.]|uniref:class I SAM-dependent methyltransferase n=1 Tax=Rhodoferax sp. TaxID=50421 RepID=UPI0025D9FEE9|nr:class I SAM-dependent methyltransferase [Rhodoferax sp.]
MQTYTDKSPPYFGHVRHEIAPALPERCGSVLEVGCGAGVTLEWLRKRPGTTHTTGIEIFEDAATLARSKADEIYCLDIEHAVLPDGISMFNTILCLDVLEHMVNPWRTLHRLVTLHLKPGGTIVVTLPNIRHHTVVLPLLLKGRWQYEEDGIMDRTHLRFFSKHSAIALLNHADLESAQCTALSFAENRLKHAVNQATLRIFEGLITPQYLLSAKKKLTTLD